MELRIAIYIEEIAPRLLRLEKANGTINSSTSADEKALCNKVGYQVEEVIQFHRTTATTIALHAGNESAIQYTPSRFELRAQGKKLSTQFTWNPTIVKRISTANKGDKANLLRFKQQSLFIPAQGPFFTLKLAPNFISYQAGWLHRNRFRRIPLCERRPKTSHHIIH